MYPGIADRMQKEMTSFAPSTMTSRSSLPQRESTPYGSETPSSLLSPPSPRCGSPRLSTMSLAHPSSTGSASKRSDPTSGGSTLYYTNYRSLQGDNHLSSIISRMRNAQGSTISI